MTSGIAYVLALAFVGAMGAAVGHLLEAIEHRHTRRKLANAEQFLEDKNSKLCRAARERQELREEISQLVKASKNLRGHNRDLVRMNTEATERLKRSEERNAQLVVLGDQAHSDNLALNARITELIADNRSMEAKIVAMTAKRRTAK